MINDKVPPQDMRAEQALLGSLIVDQSMMKKIAGKISADSFYKIQHQHIYAAIENLTKAGTMVDIVSLGNELKCMSVNIPASDLMKIANSTPTGANIEYHAKIVADTNARRQFISICHNGIESAFNLSEDIADTMAAVKKSASVSLPGRNIDSSIHSKMIDVMERVIDASRGGAKNYIETGFGKIDRRMNIRKGRLTVIASDAGVGKTSWMLCVMRYMVNQGMRPVMFSLEMTEEEIMENIIAQEAKVCHRDMVSGYIKERDIVSMTNTASKLNNYNIGLIGNDREWTVSQIRNQCIDEMDRGIDAVFIDSLGLIKPPKGYANESRSVVYNMVCEELVRLGSELSIPMTLAHHLNKDSSKRSKDWRPTLQSLDFAGERYAHNVAFLYREHLVNPTDENKNTAEFKIGKARDGIPGTIPLRFDGPTKTFSEIDEVHREPPEVMAGGIQ